MLHARLQPALAAIAICASACGGSNGGRNDDLGYDPARPLVAQSVVINENGVPVRGDGTPLRGDAIEGEWRTYRGDNGRSGTRIAPGITRPTIVWSAAVGIQGYANTPLVTDDTVFVSSQGTLHNQRDPEDGFYALRRDDGSQRWFYQTIEDVNGAMLTDTHVIGGTDGGHLIAVSRATGELAWDVLFDDPIRHAPVLFDGMLFVNQGDYLAVIDPATGSQRHRVPARMDYEWEMRGALSADSDRMYRTAEACALSAHSADDQLWSATTCMPTSEEWVVEWTYAPPTIAGDRVITLAPIALGFEDADVSLSVTDAATGERLWDVETEQDFPGFTHGTPFPGYDLRHYASMPWIMNGIVWAPLITRPNVIGFDLATGEPRAAVSLPDCRARQFPSIVGVPSRGYLARHDGTLYAFEPLTGAIRWGMQMGLQANAGVPISTAYIGLDGVDSYCHAEPWDGTGLYATPAIAEDGTLFVGSGEGILYAIQDSDW